MPDEKTLQEQLDKAGFFYFDAKTNLSRKLAGKKLSPEEVSAIVEREMLIFLVARIRASIGRKD